MGDKIKVVLADDHAILTEGTSSILAEEDFIELVGTASDGGEAERLLEAANPDILVSDISMPGKSIFDIANDLRDKSHITTKVLIFSMHESPNYVYNALNSNISGYLTKNAKKDELVKAIQAVANGEEYYSQSIAQIIVKGFKNRKQGRAENQNPIDLLSKREKEVLSLLIDGYNSKQIAEKLYLSERTVSNHRANMLQKCKVNNTVELVKLYLDHVNKW
jgi:DNA-binding NarL/FixJ family response regulator